ncbi:zinc finger Y-chromosomal protein 2-like [Cotesia typhae]|uniref:zinc finger Y-chromosomal protein 2-like n=1 Tax=Cotesia typhae TaxID=2053667 RepID=UPI003D6914DB
MLKKKQKLKIKRIPDNVSCPKCHKVYKYSRNFQRHLKFECGLNPGFKCPYCYYCTKQSSPIYFHIRRYEVRGPSVLWSGEDEDIQAEKTDEELLLSELREELLPKVAAEETQSRVIKSQRDLCSVIIKEEVDEAELQFPNPLTFRNRGETLIPLQQLKTHTCPRCFKSYMHAWHLKRHIRFECGQEPKVQCPYCMVKMKQRGHVYRHIRRCHRGQNVYVIDLN